MPSCPTTCTRSRATRVSTSTYSSALAALGGVLTWPRHVGYRRFENELEPSGLWAAARGEVHPRPQEVPVQSCAVVHDKQRPLTAAHRVACHHHHGSQYHADQCLKEGYRVHTCTGYRASVVTQSEPSLPFLLLGRSPTWRRRCRWRHGRRAVVAPGGVEVGSTGAASR